MTCQSSTIRTGKLAMLFLAGCFTALPLQANGLGQSTATKEFQKTLTLGANQTVSVEHKFGDVHIHAGGGREVKISATIRVQAHSQADADRFADQVRIDVSEDAQGVRIKTVYPSDDAKLFIVRIGGPSIRSITILRCRAMPSSG